jgi:hypothetical protein
MRLDVVVKQADGGISLDCCVGANNKGGVLLKLGEGLRGYVVIFWIVPYGGSGQSTTGPQVAKEFKAWRNEPPLLKHRSVPACSISGIHLSLCDGEVQLLLF